MKMKNAGKRNWNESKKVERMKKRTRRRCARECIYEKDVWKAVQEDRQGKEHILQISTLQLRQAICQVEYYKGVICRLHFLDNFVC